MTTKVLLVDDSRLIRQTLAEFLADDFTVFDCAFGQQAIKVIDNHQPDWLILNPVLAYNSGFELLYEIQSHPDLRGLATIIISHDKGYFDRHRSTLEAVNVQAVLSFVDLSKKKLVQCLDQPGFKKWPSINSAVCASVGGLSIQAVTFMVA